jgi:hypothetical protein
MKSAMWAFLMLALVGIAFGASTPDEVNAAFGVDFFSDENLWDDDASILAQKLAWPLESQTSTDLSYRKYPGPSERVLGCRSYSNALYGDDGHVSAISILFANKGDAVDSLKEGASASDVREVKGQIRDYKKGIIEDKKNLTLVLTKLFGDPVPDRFGQGRQTTELVKRWDWNGHSFLLAAPRDEYVALRILPVESAKAGGRSRISDAVMKARVESRVETRPNGDVILKEMPMVNQGPKGYCVPATWERVMRYMGVPADMYVLAMAGQSGAGGGTSLEAIREGAKQSIVAAGRRITQQQVKLDAQSIARFIDKGLPIIWAMFSTDEFNDAANSRQAARSGTPDPATWKKELAEVRKSARKFHVDKSKAHVCLIIGYNKQTGEVALSDSWGPAFAERWVTFEEAKAVSQDLFYVIQF